MKYSIPEWGSGALKKLYYSLGVSVVVRDKNINKTPTNTITILIKKEAVLPSFSKNKKGVNFAPTKLKESEYIPVRKRMNPMMVMIFLFINYWFWICKSK